MNRRVIAITGPTCGGKTTFKQRLLAEFPDQFEAVTTTTSRAPRSGEVDGEDYHFVSTGEFQEKADNGAFLEGIEINGYHYGIEKARLESALSTGRTVVLVVDPNGVKALERWGRAAGTNIIRVLATAPIEELRDRLQRRVGIVASDEVSDRMRGLEEELANVSSIGWFDHVVNTR